MLSASRHGRTMNGIYTYITYCIIFTYVYIYIYPGIPKTPVFGVVHGKTPDFGVVRESPQKCNLRFFNKIWYTSYVMKTWRFIIQERAFFCHGSWFYMHLSWKNMPYLQKNHAKHTHIPQSHWHAPYIQSVQVHVWYNVHAVMSSIVWTRRLSLLTPLQSGGGIFHGFLTFFSRTFGVVVDTFGVVVDTFGVELTETSRKFHGSFSSSTSTQGLRKPTIFVVWKWKKSLNIWSKSRKQHVDLLFYTKRI